MANTRGARLRYAGMPSTAASLDPVCGLCCYEKSCCYLRHADAGRYPLLCRFNEAKAGTPARTYKRAPALAAGRMGWDGRRVVAAVASHGGASSRPFPPQPAPARASPATRHNHLLSALPILLSAALLLWPALLNGYPIVFDDTGTYLSQAVHRYLGWDRPVFYSLFLFPLHLTLTTWPAIAAQALLAAYTLHLARRALLPAVSPWWLVPFVAMLTIGTALPWFASQLMPDIFTPLLILALALLLFTPERLSKCERLWLVLFAAFMIAAQASSVLLSLTLLLVLAPLRRSLGAAVPLGRAGLIRLAAAPLLAMTALISVNFAGHGRAALAPFGNVFLLARVIYDGPGMDVLRRDCPTAGWRLCPFLDRFPATSDEFLWQPDSPIVLAGGHKRVSADADAIIAAALRAEPGTELLAWLRNGIAQLGSFTSGDELHACPTTVTPWIDRDFPRFERAAYAAARQTGGLLAVPDRMRALHVIAALGGIAGCEIVLLVALRRRHVAAGFAAAVLLGVLANALIAGGLSTPHHRYGSRVMLLAPAVALLGGVALVREESSGNSGFDRVRATATKT